MPFKGESEHAWALTQGHARSKVSLGGWRPDGETACCWVEAQCHREPALGHRLCRDHAHWPGL